MWLSVRTSRGKLSEAKNLEVEKFIGAGKILTGLGKNICGLPVKFFAMGGAREGRGRV